MNKIVIQKVNHLNTHKLIMLVEESMDEGFRHLKRLVNDFEMGTNKFDKDGEALFIAYQNSDIVGVCGLNRDPYANSKEVGRVRRLYVSSRVRRFGVGRMLMDSVIVEARKNYNMLVLRTDNPIADTFYRSIGFTVNIDSENDSHFLRLAFNYYENSLHQSMEKGSTKEDAARSFFLKGRAPEYLFIAALYRFKRLLVH